MTEPRSGPRGRNWCFTLNNYTPEDLDRLSTPNDSAIYMIYGKEVGASGTPHLQGTVCWKDRKRLTQVKKLVGEAHCTVTRFLAQSIEYCKKDGDVTEWGVPPKDEAPGKRSDMEDFKASVKEGVTSMEQLRELHSSICAQYPRFVKDYIQDLKVKVRVPCHPLREWQQNLNEILRMEPDERQIIFVVDKKGNQGKSWFARYYHDIHDNVQIILPGKKADMAYTVKDSRVFIMDCPRSKQGDFIQYDFLEELKNGWVFSGKYEPEVKVFKVPHVIVLMNEQPEMTKLSDDRYKIINLT
jgi:hypothetical protein